MSVYHVPLVSANLSPQEMISQMVDTLEFLHEISNDIFSKVSVRIQENKDKINSINRRIEAANAKINSIKGSKKATKIFSSSRFPGNLQSENVGLFQGTNLQMKRHKLQVTDFNLRADTNKVFFPNNNQQPAKLVFPLQPQSVSELLVHNSEDLAYWKQPASVRSSKVSARQKNESVPDVSLGDAPWSITQRESLDQNNPVNFSYIPGLGDVPELNLPLDLPDLPGIADDLIYNEDVGPGIAPSLMAALPDISSLTDNVTFKTVSPTPPPPPHIAPPTFLPVSSAKMQSSLEPPIPILPLVCEIRSSTPQPSAPFAPPPPPPPPPPDFSKPPVSPAATIPEAKRQISSLPSGGDDVRSNLMAAIREAGGASKLKSSARLKHSQSIKENQERHQTTVDKGKSNLSNPAGDLMSDLFNKLSMRRKGISGQNAEETESSREKGTDSVGPMARISQMIPPPPLPGANLTSSDEVDDWK